MDLYPVPIGDKMYICIKHIADMKSIDSRRVIFYSSHDLSLGWHLKKAEKILRSNFVVNDINDVLELYNISKMFNHELYLHSWTSSDKETFKEQVAKNKITIGLYMSKIDDNNLLDHYKDIISDYIHSFWELVNDQKVYKRISDDVFKNLLLNKKLLINEILKHKGIVQHYGNALRGFLLNYPKSAEILLDAYEVLDPFKTTELYIPKSLTTVDKEQIISNYLDSPDANLNYIELITTMRSRDEIVISDKIRLKAMRSLNIKTEEAMKESIIFNHGVSIGFEKELKQHMKVFLDDDNIVNYIYSADYIIKYKEPFPLLMNFRNLFGYLDNLGKVALVSKYKSEDTIEKIMGLRSKNDYLTGKNFRHIETKSTLEVMAYHMFLEKLDIQLESVIESVYTETFVEKYQYDKNAFFTAPTAASFLEKVRIIAPEFESILKQYKLFVEEGEIDNELLQISSTPLSIKDVPSLLEDKYVYLSEIESDNEVSRVMYHIFSSQSLLHYVEPFKGKGYKNLFDLLVNEDVSYGSYKDYQKEGLDYLIDNGYLSLIDNNILKFTNLTRIIILRDLHYNEFSTYFYYSEIFRREIKLMQDEGIVYMESSLFSKQEQSYFNYYLNKSEFTNGHNLRNSYLHGTNPAPGNENKHVRAYFTYLKLLVILVLKIEDDLGLYRFLEKQ